MRKVILPSLAYAAVIAGPATAADMLVKAKPPAVVTTTIDWSGGYFGAGLGEAWTDPHRFMPNLPQVGIPPTTFASSGSDGIYDIHAGLQQQWGQWILGVEASYTSGFTGMASSVSVSPPEPFTHLAATTKVTELITVGPWLGVAWGPVMAYGTSGFHKLHRLQRRSTPRPFIGGRMSTAQLRSARFMTKIICDKRAIGRRTKSRPANMV